MESVFLWLYFPYLTNHNIFQINSCLYYAQKVILLAIQCVGVCILIIKPITHPAYRKAKNDCTADYRT